MVIIWIILGALLLWEIQSVWYAKHWDEELFVSLAFSRKSTVRGESCELLETIENRKLLPLPVLKVKFQMSRQLAFEDAGTESSVTDQYYRNDVFSVRPYTRHIRSLRFTCKKRGFYRINGLDVVAGDLFLTHELPKSLPVDSQLYVYPRPFRGMDFNGALRQLNGEVATKRHLQEDPFEYLGIREYTPRDTLRDVNWKATARSGELKVNQKGCTAQRSVRLVVNLEDGAILRQEDLLEASIEMAAAAAELFIGQGIRTSLETNGPDLLTKEAVCLKASCGAGHLDSIFRGLARIDLEKPAPSFEPIRERLEEMEDRESLCTIFFSADARPEFQQLLEKFRKEKREFIWFCPVNRIVRPEINAGIRPYTRLIDVEEGGRL